MSIPSEFGKNHHPGAEPLSGASASSLEPSHSSRAAQTILLVEDEEQLREVACKTLRRGGYHVLEASDGKEAYLTAQKHSEAIHLLLTDVVMPHMSGRKLAELLTPSRPEMKVLFASGYTGDVVFRHGMLKTGVAFMQKPFTHESLLRRVREVLEDR